MSSRAPQEQCAAVGPPEGTQSTEAWLSHREQKGTGLMAAALGGHPVYFAPRGTGTLRGAWAPQGTLEGTLEFWSSWGGGPAGQPS